MQLNTKYKFLSAGITVKKVENETRLERVISVAGVYNVKN